MSFVDLVERQACRTGPPRSAFVQGNASPYKDGDTVALTCHVEADNMADISIEWLNDGELVESATEWEYSFRGHPSMSGKYACRAKNSAGTALSRAITVDIREYSIKEGLKIKMDHLQHLYKLTHERFYSVQASPFFSKHLEKLCMKCKLLD